MGGATEKAWQFNILIVVLVLHTYIISQAKSWLALMYIPMFCAAHVVAYAL